MVVRKRSRIINDDEPFDSFKRRQINQAKTQNSSDPRAAAELAGEQPANASRSKADTSPRQDFRANGARGRPSRKVNWHARLEQSFTTGERLRQSELEKKSRTTSNGQLEFASSDGIKSPMLPSSHASACARQKKARKNFWSNKLKRRVHVDFAQRIKANFQSFKRPRQTAGTLRRCKKWDKTLQSRKCDEKKPTQGDGKSLPPFTLPRKVPDYFQQSLKTRKRMMPLSTLIISPQEYFKLSARTPVALEREEKYNWGHLKKHALVRNAIMRKKERVLQMSSQAPAPTAELENHRVSLQHHPLDLKALSRTSCKTSPDSVGCTLASRGKSVHQRFLPASQRQPTPNNDHPLDQTSHASYPKLQVSKFFQPCNQRVDLAASRYELAVLPSKSRDHSKVEMQSSRRSPTAGCTSINIDQRFLQGTSQKCTNDCSMLVSSIVHDRDLSTSEYQPRASPFGFERGTEDRINLEGNGKSGSKMQLVPHRSDLRFEGSLRHAFHTCISDGRELIVFHGQAARNPSLARAKCKGSIESNRRFLSFGNNGGPKSSVVQCVFLPKVDAETFSESDFKLSSPPPSFHSPKGMFDESKETAERQLNSCRTRIKSLEISPSGVENVLASKTSPGSKKPKPSCFEDQCISRKDHEAEVSESRTARQNTTHGISKEKCFRTSDSDFQKETGSEKPYLGKFRLGQASLKCTPEAPSKGTSLVSKDFPDAVNSPRSSRTEVRTKRSQTLSPLAKKYFKCKKLVVNYHGTPKFCPPRRRGCMNFMPSYFATRPRVLISNITTSMSCL